MLFHQPNHTIPSFEFGHSVFSNLCHLEFMYDFCALYSVFALYFPCVLWKALPSPVLMARQSKNLALSFLDFTMLSMATCCSCKPKILMLRPLAPHQKDRPWKLGRWIIRIGKQDGFSEVVIFICCICRQTSNNTLLFDSSAVDAMTLASSQPILDDMLIKDVQDGNCQNYSWARVLSTFLLFFSLIASFIKLFHS